MRLLLRVFLFLNTLVSLHNASSSRTSDDSSQPSTTAYSFVVDTDTASMATASTVTNAIITVDIEYEDVLYGLYGSVQHYIDETEDSFQYCMSNVTLNSRFGYSGQLDSYFAQDNNNLNYSNYYQLSIPIIFSSNASLLVGRRRLLQSVVCFIHFYFDFIR